MSDYADIIKKCEKEWACPELMESVNRVGGRKIPFSSPSLNWATYGGVPRAAMVEFYGVPGGGKAQPMYSKILTPNGFTTMKEISIGDTVFDGKGNICKVIAIFPQGKRRIYEIITQGNNRIRVADNHLNSVWWYNKGKKCREDFVWDTETLIQKFNSIGKRRKIRIDIPEVDFDERDVPIDPYLLGALIGDGSIHDGNFSFTNSEDDVVASINDILGLYDYELRRYSNRDYHWRLCVKTSLYVPGQKTYLRKSLEDMGLRVKSVDKFIPKDYLYNSRDVRLRLLQGLFDTDGYISMEGKVEFSTSSKQLSDDFAFLVRSLGIRDTIHQSVGRYKDADDNLVDCATSYRHTLKIPNGLKFYSSNKHTSRYKDRQHPPLRNITSIEYVGEEECQCIMVDSPEHTYISDDFIVTHNTTTAIDICKNALDMFNDEYTTEVLKLQEEVAKGKKEAKIKLQDLNDRGPKKVLYIDLEHSFDKKWAGVLGITNKAIDIMQPPDVSAESILQKVQELISTGAVGLIVLDSVPSLVSQKELDKKYGEASVAPIAGLMTAFCRKVTQLLARYDCTFIFINQMRASIANPYADQTPGGEALKFYCSLRLKFLLGSPLDFLGNDIPQKSENPAGYKITVKIVKQKSAPFDRKLGEYYLMSQSGLRVDFEFANLAITKYEIIRKNAGWYYFYDPDTKEPYEVDGNPVKVNGLAKVYDYLQMNREYDEKMRCYIINDINSNGIEIENNVVDNIIDDE